jgi:Gluconate kinase
MGVSGCGKSTIASMLAHRLNWIFEEGDWFHPPSNVEKMHGGVPLTDEDRWPWLHGIAAWIDATRRVGNHGTVACSALKRAYRDVLSVSAPTSASSISRATGSDRAPAGGARRAFHATLAARQPIRSPRRAAGGRTSDRVSIVRHPREIVAEIVKRLGKGAAPSSPGVAAAR